MHKIKIGAAIQPRKCTFSFSPGEAISLRADSVNDGDCCCCSSIARRGGGGCDPFLSVDTRLFLRSASDWRQHPFRYAAASHGCFDRPRPAGVEAGNNHDTAPPCHSFRQAWIFFFSSLPSDLSSLLSQEQKKKIPRLSKRVTVSAAFFCIHAAISKDLYFSPPLGERGRLGAGCSLFDF